MLTQIKILGIGSPWGDDQVGLYVIEMLTNNYKRTPTVLIEGHDRPGVRLLDLLQGAHIVYLIDAVKTNQANVGKIHRLQNEEIHALPTLLSTHNIGVAETLKLGRVLNMLPPTIIFYGIEINVIERPTGNLTKTVAQAAEQLALNIAKEINLIK